MRVKLLRPIHYILIYEILALRWYIYVLSHVLEPGCSSQMMDGIIVDFKIFAFWFQGGTLR